MRIADAIASTVDDWDTRGAINFRFDLMAIRRREDALGSIKFSSPPATFILVDHPDDVVRPYCEFLVTLRDVFVLSADSHFIVSTDALKV